MTTTNDTTVKDTTENPTESAKIAKRPSKNSEKETPNMNLPVKVEKTAMMLVDNRPVSPSDLTVWKTVNMAGLRPITTSNINFSMDIVHFVGNRPIAKSDLHISSVYASMGAQRPIADNNNIEEMGILIGYLD